MKISASWLRKPSTQSIMEILISDGHEAYFVGGCVRDTLFNLNTTDVDIATSAHPKKVLEIMKKAGLKAIPTGIDHGTVTVVADQQSYEITTFREDIETDGRKAKVKFSKSLTEDAKRRDFSINAIYCEQDGTILDPLGGLTDIAEKRITFIGDPYERIKEDYLRILRFFRFAALFSTNKKFLEIEISALSDLRDGLDTISAERKSDEIFKLFAAPNLIFSISLMEKTNIISKVFHTYYFNCLATLQDIENRHEISPCATRRLAAYTEDNLKLHLRFSNKTANTHKILRDEAEGPKGAAELSYRYSEKLALDIILVRASLQGTEFSKDILSQIKLGSAVEFPIKSSDLSEYFSGPKLGTMLKLLEQKWIESDFTLNKKKLLSTIT